MSDSEASFVPVALSTAQDEGTFTPARQETTAKNRSAYLGPNADTDLRKCISEYYCISEIVQYLKENDQYSNITLQFPDSLVQDSSIITQLLQDNLKNSGDSNEKVARKFWVLADTAYSTCCVDEVASEHVQADAVIHFGEACLNPVKSLSVLYSFGKPYLDLNTLVHDFKELHTNKNAAICLMADAPHTADIKLFHQMLTDDGYDNLLYALLDDSVVNDHCVVLKKDHFYSADKQVYKLGNRAIYSANSLLEPLAETSLQDYDLFHITIPEDPHLLMLSTSFNSVALYDTQAMKISQGPYPSLMKRYKYMHVARTAGCIGILVNTLSLKNTKETINTLINHIRKSGKKHYLFVVGKPNVAKLANFEPVDIWCILGCGQGGIILDQYNEFYKPIITPYELTMALKDEVTWTGKWVVDFRNVLHEIERESSNEETNTSNAQEDSVDYRTYDDDAPEFDAVTGRYVSTSRPLRRLQRLEIESPDTSSKEIIKSVTGGVIIKGTVSVSAAQLRQREWTGLGSDYSSQVDYDESGADVEEGISGVASSYNFDKSNMYQSR